MDNGDLAPAIFSLILKDGYTITGNVTSGSLVVHNSGDERGLKPATTFKPDVDSK